MAWQQRWHNVGNPFALVTTSLIHHLYTTGVQVGHDIFFQDKTNVIAAKCNPFMICLAMG
jgi:hypothetical protein